MSYRNKVYVAFDGDSDIRYYNLMRAWKQNDGMSFNFYDAHDINEARDSSQEESIKRQLRERLSNSKMFVLLVGEKTKDLRKFVPWEIDQALKLQLPIIVVNLNGIRCLDRSLCPTVLYDKEAIHISFGAKILEHALMNWSGQVNTILEQKATQGSISGCSISGQPYYYDDSVYDKLGG